MSQAAVIRPVSPEDLAPILHLIALVPEAPAWSTEDFRRLLQQGNSVGSFTTDAALTRTAWVIEQNAKILGLVVVQCLRVPTKNVGTHAGEPEVECELESILVHPHARRTGLGQRLLQTAMQWCFDQNATILRLEVRSGNDAAIRLYERSGFTRTGTRPRYYSHPEEDALLMQYAFSPKPQ